MLHSPYSGHTHFRIIYYELIAPQNQSSNRSAFIFSLDLLSFYSCLFPIFVFFFVSSCHSVHCFALSSNWFKFLCTGMKNHFYAHIFYFIDLLRLMGNK